MWNELPKRLNYPFCKNDDHQTQCALVHYIYRTSSASRLNDLFCKRGDMNIHEEHRAVGWQCLLEQDNERVSNQLDFYVANCFQVL
jgi:hypothetical protein